MFLLKERSLQFFQPQYKPLNYDDIREIHDTSIKVFEEIGFEVQLPEALSLFKKAGAKIIDGSIVRLKETKIREIISQAPSEITLFGRDDKHNITLGKGNSFFSTGGTALNILDYDKNNRRPAKLKDLIDVVRIVDQMDNIHVMLLPTYPNELDVNDVDLNRFFTGLCYTSKHIMGGIYTEKGINQVISMAEKIAGSAKNLRERPFISMIACGISPLRLDSKYGKFMIQIARENIPLAVPVEPLCGATAPITLAGTLVIQNCDALTNIMLTQLANPGCPVIYGSVATSVNMHDVAYLGGPVESGMINAATAQLARHYNLPYYSTAGISDSKTLDVQCGYETAINNLLVSLAGGDIIHDAAGLMEFATTVSKEKIIIDNEILGMALRAFRGIEVNEKTLAFDIIKNVGPGGNFMMQRHTRKFMHKEHFFPDITNRDRRDVWSSRGSKTTSQKAHEKVEEILSETPKYYIQKDLIEKLQNDFSNINKNAIY